MNIAVCVTALTVVGFVLSFGLICMGNGQIPCKTLSRIILYIKSSRKKKEKKHTAECYLHDDWIRDDNNNG